MSSANSKRSPIELAQGQIWKTQGAYIEIVQLGKRLLDYRMTSTLGQKMVRIQITGVRAMQDYLKAHRARLLKTEA
jgi:hypothetical protein